MAPYPLAGRTAAVAAPAADPLLPPPDPRPLAGTDLDWYADVYYVAARTHHWTPDAVDQLEVWQLWAALGHALPDDEWRALTEPRESKPQGRFRGRGRGGSDPVPSGRDLTAERARWMRGQAPKPTVTETADRRLAQIISRAPGTPHGTA